MFIEQLRPFIHETIEDGYLLDIWNNMMSRWNISQNFTQKDLDEFEQFLSKLMEIERACVEEGDDYPIVVMKSNLYECFVQINKSNEQNWTYVLHPYGYHQQWEIFNVIREGRKLGNL